LVRVNHLKSFVKREDERVSRVGYRMYDDKRDERNDIEKYERREKPTQRKDRQQDCQDNRPP